MINWTRQHDAWLAEKCEGKDWKLPFVPDYFTDQTNALRAAKAWVAKDPKYRRVAIYMHDEKNTVEATEYRYKENLPAIRHAHTTTDLAVALAEALYRVSGGTE